MSSFLQYLNPTLSTSHILTTTDDDFIWDPKVLTTDTSDPTSQSDMLFLPDIPLFDNFSIELFIVMWMAALVLFSSCCLLAICSIRFHYKKATMEAINRIHKQFAPGRIELVQSKSDEYYMRPLRPLSPPFTEPACPEKKLMATKTVPRSTRL